MIFLITNNCILPGIFLAGLTFLTGVESSFAKRVNLKLFSFCIKLSVLAEFFSILFTLKTKAIQIIHYICFISYRQLHITSITEDF